MIAVSDFSSAQDYLISAFDQAKCLDSKVTVQMYAKRLGMGASSLKMILSRKRKPTIRQILTVARSLRLSVSETSYLETLALMDAAQGDWEASYYSKILKVKRQELKLSTLATDQKTLLSDTLALPVLVELLESKPTEIDILKLASRFKTTAMVMRNLIEDLQKNEILSKKPDGHFHIVFDKFGHKPLQKKYLQKVLAEASKKIETDFDRKDSLFVNYVINLTPRMMAGLQLDLKQVMLKYMNQEITDQSSRQIAQAGFQVYPITGK
jgi:hypothetical protein